MADPSFSCSQRGKFEEIAEGAAEHMGMAGATPEDVLKAACREYTLWRILVLDKMRGGELTDKDLLEGGMERLDLDNRPLKGKANYATVYGFSDRAAANRMVDMWANVIGVGAQLCGAYRKKINEHDFGDRRFLRLVISGEGGWQSAAKYGKQLINPPTEERAKKPRQKNGRVVNDGPAWLVPAGLVLAGGGALKTVTWETYIWRRGDEHRPSRELHEAILPLGFLGGLAFSRGSISLNQKIGGTFTDDDRQRGGKQHDSTS